MTALPPLTTIAPTPSATSSPRRPPGPGAGAPRTAPSRWRLALAGALERAADGIAPARYRPAH